MAEGADERHNRLRALREKAQSKASESTEDGKSGIRFRNYRPIDPSLTEATAEGGDNGAKDTARGKENKDQGVAGVKKATRQEEKEDAIQAELRRHAEQTGGDQLNVAPRKPDWDLKRDVAKKLDKLNRMTQKAIVEILREKLASEAAENEDEEGEEEEGD